MKECPKTFLLLEIVKKERKVIADERAVKSRGERKRCEWKC